MLIGICGGIGSGKSVVSRVLRESGYRVYDCDLQARLLMESSREIKERIRDEISPDVTDGVRTPDRRILADIVFHHEQARIRLNEIVHGALRDEIKTLADEAANSNECLFIEAAILAESGLAEMADRIWLVKADTGERILRIIERDHTGVEQALSRMRAQRNEEKLLQNYADKTSIILNDSSHSLLSQIHNLLKNS